MARHWLLSTIVVVVGSVFAFLMAVYPEQIREIISSLTGQTDTNMAFYVILGTIVLVIVLGIAYTIWMVYTKYFKIDVLIQKDSLNFIKYPYLAGTRGNIQPYTNMSYADITVHNNTDNRINDCSLEIDLRKDDVSLYKSKVVSHESTPPNPISVSIDGKGDKSFCPLSLHLESLQAFLPHDSKGIAGNFTGPLVANGQYEIFGRLLIEGKCGKWQSLGNIKIPSDLVEKAKISNNIQVIIHQRGFAVYAELLQDKVRAKFLGNFTNGDVKRALKSLEENHFQVDRIVEENGKLRKISDKKDAWVLG